MMDPGRPPELDALVALLRSATPPDDTLAEARAGVLEGAGGLGAIGPSSVGLGARITWLMLVLFAIGAPPHASPRVAAHAKRLAGAAPADARPDEPLATAEDLAPALEPEPIGTTDAIDAPASEAPAGEAPAREELVAAPIASLPEPTITAMVLTVGSDDPGKQGPGALPASSGPSAAMAEALRDYSGERYAEAAAGFQRVVDGTTDDAPEQVTKAEFFLAKCLFHMGLFHASAAAFDEVTQRGSAHPYFDASLTWLAMLAEELPEPTGVIASVGRYDAARLRTLDTESTRAHYHRLLYLLGRARYEQRELEEAVAILRTIPEGSPWALEARFFEGVSHVRARRSRPALAAFREVIEAVQEGRTGGHEDPNRLYDLAWMSVARLYYSLAMQTRDEERASELLSLAIASWRRIPLSSEHWLDSFFEETWALYMARQPGRALGHVHALDSPYFRDRADPEAQVVRAMIFFEHCQWDAAEHAVARFHDRFDLVLGDAQRALRMADTDENTLRLLLAVRAGRSRVPPSVVPALRAAFADREIGRHVASLRSIRQEQRRLDALEPGLRDRVAQELQVVRSLAEQRTAELARARIERLVADLSERMTQMDTIEVELVAQRRAELTMPNPRPMGPIDGGPIYAVQGDQVWIFDGEWWRDELPFYIQDVASRCGR